jgi:hypothetical protein
MQQVGTTVREVGGGRRYKMTSVRGVYEDGQVRVSEPLILSGRHNVIVTVLDDDSDVEASDYDFSVLDKLAGALSVREDGAVCHDKYIYAMENV